VIKRPRAVNGYWMAHDVRHYLHHVGRRWEVPQLSAKPLLDVAAI